MQIAKRVKKIYKVLASTELAILLFLSICLFAIPGTMLEERGKIYSNPAFIALLASLGLNLILCTVRRIRSLSKSVFILHCGVLATLAGCLISSFGYVETVNVYEGSMVDQAYRWDLKADVPLGMEMWIKKIHREYYPVPVKVGVLRGQEKVGLFESKTGDSFRLGDYRIEVNDFDLPTESLRLKIFQGERMLGFYDTEETRSASGLPSSFPFDFKLVAFKNPYLKRLWVDLLLSSGGKTLAEGTSEVNNPFRWNGLYFYNTQVDHDAAGRPFAGIQIVNDPGKPYVFLGFAITCLGAVMCFFRRFVKRSGSIMGKKQQIVERA